MVENGKKAVSALKSLSYDLVLMDLQMPEMERLEATRVIRDPSSRVQNSDIPIFALTARVMTGDAVECIEAGMNGYISKPINRELFLQRSKSNFRSLPGNK